jgi:hypothetical protein
MAKIPHKHADLIKAWADGATIEYRMRSTHPWTDTPAPSWAPSTEYRVKPEPHKWQKEIDAYVAGKMVQFRLPHIGFHDWRELPGYRRYLPQEVPEFQFTNSSAEYRIKPEPVVKYGSVGEAVACGLTTERGPMDNLKLTFEEGVLIAAEVLK